MSTKLIAEAYKLVALSDKRDEMIVSLVERLESVESVIRDVLYGDVIDYAIGNRKTNGLIGCESPEPDMQDIIQKLRSAKVGEL